MKYNILYLKNNIYYLKNTIILFNFVITDEISESEIHLFGHSRL